MTGEIKNVDYGSLADIDMTQAEIDADAAIILNSAVKAVKAILARRDALDRERKKKTPLVVLAGEEHTNPAQNLQLLLIMKLLANSGNKTVLAHEKPYNILSQAFFIMTKRNFDPEIAKKLDADYLDQNLSSQFFFGAAGVSYADHSTKILFRYLQKSEQIDTCFSDMAGTKTGRNLDPHDHLGAQVMKHCLHEISENIPFTSSVGMALRNYHMSHFTAEFAQKRKARIIVQQCGDAHVAGLKGRDEAKYSLSSCFKELKLPVLAMPRFCKGFYEDLIPDDHGLEENEKLFMTGLPEKTAIYNSITDESIENHTSDFEHRGAEAAYVNAVLKSMGHEEECMGALEYWKEKIEVSDDVVKQIKKWEREFYPAASVPS